MAWQILVLGAILFITTAEEWEASHLGFKFEVHPLISFLLGIVAYGFLYLLLHFGLGIAGLRERMDDASFKAMRSIWPRERGGKVIAVLAICVLNPVSEELLYRGVLIWSFGHHMDNLPLAVGISFSLTMIGHAYQGGLAALSQLFFHGLAIALLFSPLGLMGSIGLHVAGDVVPVIELRSMMDRWQVRRRAERG